jgi:hypothetical protein
VKKLESRVNQLESEKEWPLDQVRAQSGSALESAIHSVNISGYIEMQYDYNFRHGGSNGVRGDTLNFNQLHGSTNDENSFSLQNVQLLADKPLTTENSTGFRVRAEYGQVAKFHNRDANFGDTADAFDVNEAFMSWRACFGWWKMTSHVDLSAGKMGGPLGLESGNTGDASNYGLVTRSFQHALAMPASVTGLRAVLPWSDSMKTTVYLVNGWDQVRDPNDGKTAIVSQELGRYEWLNSTLKINLSYGDEGSVYNGAPPDGNKTKYAEVIWRGELNSQDSVAADAFWARQDHGQLHADGSTSSRDFHGISGYYRHNWNKDSWAALRGEYYTDNGIGVRVWEISAALGWDVAKDLCVALEYRHDNGIGHSKPFFSKSGGDAIREQDIVTASLLYKF